MSTEITTRLSIVKASKNLTNKDLANILDVTESTVKNYLTGRTKVPVDKMEKLSNELKIPLDWLIKGDKDINFETLTNIESDNMGVQFTKLLEDYKSLAELAGRLKADAASIQEDLAKTEARMQGIEKALKSVIQPPGNSN